MAGPEQVNQAEAAHSLGLTAKILSSLLLGNGFLVSTETGYKLQELTDYERRIAPMFMWGATMKEMGEAVTLGEEGVKVYRSSLYFKLGALGKEHMPRRLIEAGIVPQPVLTGEIPDLSPQEAELLEWSSYGISMKDIAAELFMAESTAKTQAGRMMRKLGVANRTAAATAGFGWGILLPDTDTKNVALDTRHLDEASRLMRQAWELLVPMPSGKQHAPIHIAA